MVAPGTGTGIADGGAQGSMPGGRRRRRIVLILAIPLVVLIVLIFGSVAWQVALPAWQGRGEYVQVVPATSVVKVDDLRTGRGLATRIPLQATGGMTEDGAGPTDDWSWARWADQLGDTSLDVDIKRYPATALHPGADDARERLAQGIAFLREHHTRFQVFTGLGDTAYDVIGNGGVEVNVQARNVVIQVKFVADLDADRLRNIARPIAEAAVRRLDAVAAS
ncbi:hypothetical protein Sru01_36000 [Sphaerisporangium rufum]|uniref:Uncharacterized protein n=1 Tax=Sphaerisporangium rufum TaxID=1381558 RepID=A0A919R3H0_9ACTN|nr:hypothetical protein [Sphaerisporangium rufum]GII78618.1 hypothetical protein Sru01_36000 [Sphaerisporangium rufum]